MILTGSVHAGQDVCRIYFGTSAQDEDRGIYMAQLDKETGSLSKAVRAAVAANPPFITIHPNGHYLYATGAGSRSEDRSGVSVSAFRIEESGMLTEVNSQPSGGTGACHVSLNPAATHLLTANYRSGSCAALPIRSDGSLAPPSSIHQHTGSSLNPKRQSQAHAHSINTSKDGRLAFVADLGTDKIMAYRFDSDSGVLELNDPPFMETVPGGGPRHFTFHPTGKFAFANLEMGNEVTVYTFDANSGSLSEIQTLSTLPAGYDQYSTSAEITASPDGRFLYVSNRGHDSIAIFSIADETGELTLLGYESVRGEVPRHFNIDPTGNFLVVANQNSSNVTVFHINPDTGMLKFTGSEIVIPNPTCVQFLPGPSPHQ